MTVIRNENIAQFPELLAKLHKLDFDYADGDGIDFEPYNEFLSKEKTLRWFRAWTGNPTIETTDYLVFGQDGTGGYAAIWNVNTNQRLLEQPIVFLGSEGEMGVIAKDFHDYLWLLASGHGPYEAVAYPDDKTPNNTQFTNFAKEHSLSEQRSASEILNEAASLYPTFTPQIESLCQ